MRVVVDLFFMRPPVKAGWGGRELVASYRPFDYITSFVFVRIIKL